MEFIKIKDLNQEEMAQFAVFFPSPQVTSIRVDQVPEILTHSKELQEKTLAVDYFSGTLCMGFGIYRDASDDASQGFPFNRDVYKISGTTLLKILPPFQDHWLNSIPSVPLMVF